MMKFRGIKQSLITILNADAAGRFVVIEAQRQTTGAKELLQKFVKVFYRNGDFPNSASTAYARPIKHKMSFDVELSVAAKAEVDLSVLKNELSTPAQRATALSNFKDASIIADEDMDELFENVFQIIFDPKNYDLGFGKYSVGDRWIENFRKDDSLPEGEYVILTGVFQVVCTADEYINSAIGTSAQVQDATIDIEGDQENNTGSAGDLGG